MRPAIALAWALLAAGCVLGPAGEPRPYFEEVLMGAPFTDLVVEVDHAPDRAPGLAAREHLLEQLRAVTSKQRVSIVLQETLDEDEGRRWSSEDLVALERETRTTVHEAPVAVLHVLYPAGKFERDGVAGVTVSGPVIGPVVVFLDTLDELRLDALPVLPLPREARDEIERATLLHEAGHALGLVDNGLPMVTQREDPDHEGHTRNAESVMYWQVESLDGIREALLHDGTVPVEFDDDDRADLRSAGGR